MNINDRWRVLETGQGYVIQNRVSDTRWETKWFTHTLDGLERMIYSKVVGVAHSEDIPGHVRVWLNELQGGSGCTKYNSTLKGETRVL